MRVSEAKRGTFKVARNQDSIQILPEIGSMGLCVFEPIWKEQEHSQPLDELLLVKTGSMKLVTKECSVSAGRGDILFIPSGTNHRDDFSLDTDFECFIVRFMWAHSREYYDFVSNDKIKDISLDAKKQVEYVIDQLAQDLSDDENIR